MIDFTDMPTTRKAYAGANGGKIAVIYDGEQYMLKFPPHPKHNKEMSYSNICISEYLGSHIFEIVGIPVQETLLGTYTAKGKTKVVVACKDFTNHETVIQDFTSLKNTLIDSGHSGYGTELSEILEAINEQSSIDPDVLKRFFWDMFIVDALIGNWDRHNGNWGFLYNSRMDEISIAPVFGCGSCLYPQADDSIMQVTLDDPAERDLRIFQIPFSAIRLNNQKIRYFDFISSLKDKGCNDALKRIVPRIDMKRITDLVNMTPYISELQKTFYLTMLKERKKKILDKSLQLLRKRERSFER
ncbi:MAG: HipA domain-containing protein [Eubacteriales bacterium]|nr:HipA domain-containing protein [Eubacteriales bacterium]